MSSGDRYAATAGRPERRKDCLGRPGSAAEARAVATSSGQMTSIGTGRSDHERLSRIRKRRHGQAGLLPRVRRRVCLLLCGRRNGSRRGGTAAGVLHVAGGAVGAVMEGRVAGQGRTHRGAIVGRVLLPRRIRLAARRAAVGLGGQTRGTAQSCSRSRELPSLSRSVWFRGDPPNSIVRGNRVATRSTDGIDSVPACLPVLREQIARPAGWLPSDWVLEPRGLLWWFWRA